MIDDKDEFARMMRAIYPGGLRGKSLLEAACNCGAYCVWFKQMGGDRCFGFDVREHWINQARFLQACCLAGDTSVRFEVCGVDDVGNVGLSPFDIGMFKGIFYHLPDPIGGLKKVADLTKELLVFNSATRSRPGMSQGLVIAKESRTDVMSGVHGLNWFPTSPRVVQRILQSMGFVEFRTLFWHRRPAIGFGRTRGWVRLAKNLVNGVGRMGMLAARTPGFFGDFDRSGFRAEYQWF